MLLRRLRAIAVLATIGAVAVALLVVGIVAVDALIRGTAITYPSLFDVAWIFGIVGAVAGAVLALTMMAFARTDTLEQTRRGRVAAAGAVTGLVILVGLIWGNGGFYDPVHLLNWRMGLVSALFVAGSSGAALGLLAVAQRGRLPAATGEQDRLEPPRHE